MAANQTSNQRNKSGNSKNQGSAPMRRPEEREESSGVYNTMSEMAEQASDYVSEAATEVQECIRERSGTAVVVSLVAGFGVGILIGRALSKPQPESRSRRYRETAEGVGRRLIDRIESMIPDALAEHFSR